MPKQASNLLGNVIINVSLMLEQMNLLLDLLEA